MEYLAYSHMYMANEETAKNAVLGFAQVERFFKTAKNVEYKAPKFKLNWQGLFRSSAAVIPDQEATEKAKYNLPKFEFNWKKILKSSAWLTLAGVSVLLVAVTQAQMASAINYVSTRGNCLNIRTSPSFNSQVIRCAPYGSRIPRVIGRNYENGFARLADGTYAYEQWIGSSYPRAYRRSSRLGVGGRFTLSNGSRGAAVSQVQRALGNVTVDGYYGSQTQRRVRSFQASNGLLADGIVGPQTRRALGIN